VDRTGSGSCPLVSFGISCVEHSSSATRELVTTSGNRKGDGTGSGLLPPVRGLVLVVLNLWVLLPES